MNSNPSDKIWVFENFLPSVFFEQLQQTFFSSHFPWYYEDSINGPYGASADEEILSFQFVHMLYSNFRVNSDYFSLFSPLLEKLNLLSILRMKLNLNLASNRNLKTGFHTDMNIQSLSGIYYLNNNDGHTLFKSGEQIRPKENQFIVFDSRLEHSACLPTDVKRRIIFNMIWLPYGDFTSETFFPLRSL